MKMLHKDRSWYSGVRPLLLVGEESLAIRLFFRERPMRIPLATAAMSMVFAFSALADDAQPKQALFAVYPITSDLQRARLARTDAEAPRLRAYVALSGNDLIDSDGALRPGAIPAEEITKALAPYVDRDNGIVVLNMQFRNEADGKLRFPSQAADEPLRSAFEKLGRSAGFKSVIVSSSFGGPTLEKKFGTVTDKVKGQADEDETPSGDDLVKVYPVRSILSLLLTDNMDCIVVVRTSLENDGENLLSPEIHAAIAKHVAAVKLRDKTKLQVSIKTRGNRISNERLDKFIGIEVTGLAKSLGFVSASVQHARTN
jgi:hypothetical protein